jgi:DNA-binding CsgD family transcriptional regulator/tetratricopeptide (TPR) repeat protein
MSAASPVAGLQGRSVEKLALGQALDVLASGRQTTILVEGEAGIGKTRLLTDTLDQARDRGFQVSFGSGEELERTRPFGVVAGALGCARSSPDPRRAAIATLLATHGVAAEGPITITSDPGLQFRAVDAFVDLAEELALHAPLVIGLDDLQWADPSSLLTISAIARRLTGLPLALICCFRPSPREPQLQRTVDALQAAGAQQLTLHRLTQDAVSALVSEAVGAEAGSGLLRAIAGAGGNPLFVTELLSAIRQEGLLQTSDGRADVAARSLPPMPPTLRLTILRRVSFLPEETLQALRSASIMGGSFTLTDLSTSTARSALSLSDALAEAIAAGVLADEGARLRFRHDLIRDAIYEDLPGSVRLALHREAGQRLAAAGAPTSQVAEHLARGAIAGDASAVEWLTRAAREAATRSPDVAADLLGRAITLLDPRDPGRDRLLAEQAGSLMWAGRVTDSERACRAVLDRTHEPAADGPARICLGLALVASGRPRDALRELEAAAQVTETEQANGLAWASVARLWLGDLDGATATAEQARSAAAATGDPIATSTALGSLVAVTERRGHLREAGRMIDDALRLADQTPGRQGHRPHPLHADRGFILAELDQLDEAAATLRTGRRICEELGVGWHLPSYHTATAVERYIVGEWDDAIVEIEASIQLADETGMHRWLVLSHSVLSLIKLHRNDIAGAVSAAAIAAGALAATETRYRSQWAPWARALTLEADGRHADAFAALAEAWDECAAIGDVIEYRALGPDLVRLALAVGDTRRARDVSLSVAELAARNDVPSVTGAALRCRGLRDDDAETLQAAVSAYGRSPRPLELGLACEDAGAAFARRGVVDRARPLLEQAVEIYERLDAARDLARAEAVQRAAGIRRGRRGTRRRPQHGWSSLTASEQTVARLVAEGLSNPQIGERLYVSRRTVQTHLAHVFTKLDISSRSQLAAETARHP